MAKKSLGTITKDRLFQDIPYASESDLCARQALESGIWKILPSSGQGVGPGGRRDLRRLPKRMKRDNKQARVPIDGPNICKNSCDCGVGLSVPMP